MEIVLGLLCVFFTITLLGHSAWVILRWLIRLILPIQEHEEPAWRCPSCGAMNPPKLQLCRSCRLDRSGPMAGELADLAGAERQLRQLRKSEPTLADAFDQVLARVEARRHELLSRKAT